MTSSTKLPDNAGKGCWRTVGVWGRQKPRCPLLEDVTHCRHCQVYVNAGRQLFDRVVSEDYRRQHADTVAQRVEVVTGTARASALVFRLGGELLALPTEVVEMVVEPMTVHCLPHRRDKVIRGLVTLQGRVRICVDLAQLLGLTTGGDDASSQKQRYMVAIGHAGRWFVFEAAAVLGVHRYAPEAVRPAPAHLGASAFTQGMITLDADPVGLLDKHVVFDHLIRRASQ